MMVRKPVTSTAEQEVGPTSAEVVIIIWDLPANANNDHIHILQQSSLHFQLCYGSINHPMNMFVWWNYRCSYLKYNSAQGRVLKEISHVKLESPDFPLAHCVGVVLQAFSISASSFLVFNNTLSYRETDLFELNREKMLHTVMLCLPVIFVPWSDSLPTRRQPGPVNNRPIIGILTQEVEDDVMKMFGKTYIPASYVKYIESAGSRVVPIRLTQSTAVYENIFKSINGLLLIGGSSDLKTSDFAKVAGIFYRLALKANDAGDSFPIWGTCLGMQLLTCLVAGENLLTKTTAENMALPLNLTKEAHSSQMFEGFPSDVMAALSQEALTGNFHQYGVTMKTFKENEKLQSFFSILSTNTAENGAIFVSTIEGRTYPFYGVQWHPEVNRFQWDPKFNFPHSSDAVRVASLLAEFFVNEGRRSLHHFDQPEEEAMSLIYNYTPTYAGNFTGYEQIYFF